MPDSVVSEPISKQHTADGNTFGNPTSKRYSNEQDGHSAQPPSTFDTSRNKIVGGTEGQQPETIDIATVAFECWHQRGCPDGSPEIDWYEAERIVRSRGDKTSSASA
jgi:hypothetical protein